MPICIIFFVSNFAVRITVKEFEYVSVWRIEWKTRIISAIKNFPSNERRPNSAQADALACARACVRIYRHFSFFIIHTNASKQQTIWYTHFLSFFYLLYTHVHVQRSWSQKEKRERRGKRAGAKHLILDKRVYTFMYVPYPRHTQAFVSFSLFILFSFRWSFFLFLFDIFPLGSSSPAKAYDSIREKCMIKTRLFYIDELFSYASTHTSHTLKLCI